ncbi:MAG: class I SAM-dependent methyltransferase, partial [Dermatophilaceae bacterium]
MNTIATEFVDEYRTAGEYVDVLIGPAWAALEGPVREALHRPSSGVEPVVDLGAGTGLGLGALTQAMPAAPVLAVEPSPVLRAVLTSRVTSDPGLRERVTIVAADALGADLPDRLGAVLAMNMIGHLDSPSRMTLWRRIAERLVPGGPLVVNLQPPAEPTAVEHTSFGSVRVGRYTYESGGSAEPTGPDAVTWRIRYRVLREDGSVVRESSADYRWHVLSSADLVRELAEAGLDAEAG